MEWTGHDREVNDAMPSVRHAGSRMARRAVALACAFTALTLNVYAGSRTSASYAITSDSLDAGGGQTASASFANHGSAGAIVGVGTAAPPSGEVQLVAGALPQVSPPGMPPVIATAPAASTAIAGNVVNFTVTATGDPLPGYQWQRRPAGDPGGVWENILDDIAYTGATTATLVIHTSGEMNGSEFRVVVRNGVGPDVISVPVVLTITFPPRLLNLSTRGLVQTGDGALIPGFVISGTANKRLLIRGIGPTLGNFGVNGVLGDPLLTLKRTVGDTTTTIATNDNWGIPQGGTNVADLLAITTAVGAFDLGSGSADAALLVDLEPGQYSVVTEGVGGGTGIAIVELYDADSASTTSRLINISTRGFVGTGDQVMIPGFVISSEGPKTLLIRAVGPTLADFGVSGTLADPRLVVNRTEVDGSNTLLLTQDNWGENPDAANTDAVADQVGAFALTAGSADAAFVITLPPGVYTVVGSSADGTATGVVLVEIYVVP